MSRPARVEVYADVWCPFTHVALRRLTEMRRARACAVPVRVRAWPLEWINGHPLEPTVVAAEIDGLRASVAPEIFAGFDPARFPATTIPALGLAAAAYATGDDVGDALSLRMRDALFEEGRDIADERELRAIAREFGVEPPPPEVARAAVRADWDAGRARDVLGSPHFFAGGRNWFCPSLRISHVGADFDISMDTEAFDDFYATAFA